MLISKDAPPGAPAECSLPLETLEGPSRIYSNGAKNTASLRFPLSPRLSPLCLFQLLNLKQGHLIDKRRETCIP